jgi:hypothetical protein
MADSLGIGTLIRIPKGLYSDDHDDVKLIKYKSGKFCIKIGQFEHDISTVSADNISGLYSINELAVTSRVLHKHLVRIIDISSTKGEKSKIQIVGQTVVTSVKGIKHDRPQKTINSGYLEESDIE